MQKDFTTPEFTPFAEQKTKEDETGRKAKVLHFKKNHIRWGMMEHDKTGRQLSRQ